MGIRVAIIDHEPLMAARLKDVLQQQKSFPIDEVCICYEGEAAVADIMQHRPDLVFLTIEMPRVSGLAIVAALRKAVEVMPSIVFVTGSEKLAAQAFQMDILDYLVKPVCPEEVQRVFRKFMTLRSRKEDGAKAAVELAELPEESVKPAYSKKFTVTEGDTIRIIDASRIRMVYAQKRKVFLVTTEGKTYQTRVNLTHFEQRLPQNTFFRCHRNYIVNVDEIQQIEPWFNHQYVLVLKGESPVQVPVGRSYLNRIREYIEL
ncbi:MAG: LytTR family DNA-binding domain-containing protein [Megasphaera sp.]|jgi:DNA-binding LytR/AlgR family response regulator|nr:LytTR family DNA-binding domain-containing protein [Megasphaera sp.]